MSNEKNWFFRVYIYIGDEILPSYILGGGFKYVLIFTPIWGRFSF